MTSTRLAAAMAALWLLSGAPSPALSQQPAATTEQARPAEADPARIAAAQQLVKASKVEQQLAETMPILMRQIGEGIAPLFESSIPSEKGRTELREIMKHSMTEMEKIVMERQGELIALMAGSYARTLTVEQMTGLAQFYESPAGQKFIAASPRIASELVPMILGLISGKPLQIDRNVDPAALEAAREAMRVSKSEQLLDAMLGQMEPPAEMLPPDAAGSPEANDMLKKLNDMQTNMTSRRGEMLDLMASIWAKHFTVEEMRAVIAFYRTPVGTSVIDAMPALIADQQSVTQGFYQSISTDLIARMQTMMKTRGLPPQ
jgi:hypothetical protein